MALIIGPFEGGSTMKCSHELSLVLAATVAAGGCSDGPGGEDGHVPKWPDAAFSAFSASDSGGSYQPHSPSNEVPGGVLHIGVCSTDQPPVGLLVDYVGTTAHGDVYVVELDVPDRTVSGSANARALLYDGSEIVLYEGASGRLTVTPDVPSGS